MLIGDWGQLPPVMDMPMYTTMPRTEISDLGSTAYHHFDQAVILDKVMRQAGQDCEQEVFRDLLMRMRNAESTISDWRLLMKRTPAEVGDTSSFAESLHLYATTADVADHNARKLRGSGQPVAVIKALHKGPGASKASPDEAGGLDPVVCIAEGARVMLCANLWVDVGLVNGAIGTVVSICFENGHSPPDLPVAVTVRFDSYTGPTLSDSSVPIAPLSRTWFGGTKQCSRLQLPLRLAWAVTIHKAQGMTLNKAVIDIGKKEFSSGLTFVACSRVRHLADLLFVPPFPYQRLSSLGKSIRLLGRLKEDARLASLGTTRNCDRDPKLPREEAHAPPIDHTLNSADAGWFPSSDAADLPLESAMDVDAPLPVDLPSASTPSEDKMRQDSASIPTSENKPDVEIVNVPSSQTGDHDHTMKYYPVNEVWQRRTCQSMGLIFVGPNGVTPGGPTIPLTPPVKTVPIIGDGNCLFRAISYLITGSQQQHMSIRQASVCHMREIEDLLFRTGTLLRSVYEGGIDDYIASSEIDCAGAWGSDVEMLTLAHLLNTPIYSYVEGIVDWTRYNPSLRNLESVQTLQDNVETAMGIYIRHRSNHFDVVKSLSFQ